jgi:hypothetical protein
VESARDGNLAKLSAQDLADVLDYDGDAERLRAALIDSEFLTSDGIVVGWQERYAEKFDFYQRRAKAAAEARWRRQQPPSPDPSHTQTEEENRSEESEIRLASTPKHSSSMLEASGHTHTATWPSALSDSAKASLAEELRTKPEALDKGYLAFRAAKLTYRDPAPSSDDEAFALFEVWFTTSKPAKKFRAMGGEDWEDAAKRFAKTNTGRRWTAA